MIEIRTKLQVEASPEAVWSVLAALTAYPRWNPMLREVQGTLAAGAKMQGRLRTARGKNRKIELEVVAAEPGRRLRWRARRLAHGLLDAEQYFRLEPAGRGAERTNLTHGVVLRGWLARIAGRRLAAGTKGQIEALGRTLKRRAELQGNPAGRTRGRPAA